MHNKNDDSVENRRTMDDTTGKLHNLWNSRTIQSTKTTKDVYEQRFAFFLSMQTINMIKMSIIGNA